ncbi:MAG TPA: hypothetical protein DCR24_06640 [Bacillus bacterium]|nr:hypothetical protein [Bacillus sp. (in: firmicutes)]
MKKFLVIMLTIACIFILLIGNHQWNEKVRVNSHSSTVLTEVKAKDHQQGEQTERMLDFAKNWPTDARNLFQVALDEGRPYEILIAGSPALGTEPGGWSSIVKTELEKVYEDTVAVTIKEYDLTSQQVVEEKKHEELAAEKADLILLEPFILKDNGYVANERSADYWTEMIDSIKAKKTDTIVILQPANPLSNAKYYPLQVEGLKAYTEANRLPYLDHWSAWPKTEAEMRDYIELTRDPSFPNEKGHQVWADYLIKYFISK